MRVVTAAEMREMDRKAIEDYGIPGVVLMENAGRQVADIVAGVLGDLPGQNVVVLAGKGNNGGDGFVAARHLKNRGAGVRVFLAAGKEDIRGDARVNLEIWLKMGGTVVNPLEEFPSLERELARAEVVVDALYGTGFRGAVRENVVPLLEAVNSGPAPVVAVDIPSGLEADTGHAAGPCIKAAHTVTFGLPKIGLLTGRGPEYTGRLHVADISLPREVPGEGQAELITREKVRNMLPDRPAAAHKGTFGHVLVVGGSPGMGGAISLAARACARSGAGLVTAGVPWGLLPVCEIKLTEMMTAPLPETVDGFLSAQAAAEVIRLAESKDVLAVGPGLGKGEEVAEMLTGVLARVRIPCVIDADGINALSRARSSLREVRAGAVITPHPGEMARFTGCSTADVQADRPGVARRAAEQTGAVVVLKGAGTVVATPGGKLYINATGNPGMASGGTGDVLTGIIAGLVAQGLAPEDAAVAGVYLHGLAGDLAVREKGSVGILAGDLIEALPAAIKNCGATMTGDCRTGDGKGGNGIDGVVSHLGGNQPGGHCA